MSYSWIQCVLCNIEKNTTVTTATIAKENNFLIFVLKI